MPTTPRKFPSPRAARRYAEAHAIEIHGEQIAKAINEGNRIITVPRGIARVLGDALAAEGWGVAINPVPDNSNLLALCLADADELAPSGIAPAPDVTQLSQVPPPGMTNDQVARLGLEPVVETPSDPTSEDVAAG